MMVWKMYLLSNMAILGIYVRFQNVPKRLSQLGLAGTLRDAFPPKSSKVLTQTAFFFLDFGTGLVEMNT